MAVFDEDESYATLSLPARAPNPRPRSLRHSAPFMSNLGGLSPGKLVATANGKCTAHALASLQDRGKLFISSGQVRASGVFTFFCFATLSPDVVYTPPPLPRVSMPPPLSP